MARYDKRKVVVATNVAETSLTIDDIRCVIDSGPTRIPRHAPPRVNHQNTSPARFSPAFLVRLTKLITGGGPVTCDV